VEACERKYLKEAAEVKGKQRYQNGQTNEKKGKTKRGNQVLEEGVAGGSVLSMGEHCGTADGTAYQRRGEKKRKMRPG